MSTRNRMDDVSSADLRPDSLVGSYFLGDDQQGMVVAEPTPGVYLVEMATGSSAPRPRNGSSASPSSGSSASRQWPSGGSSTRPSRMRHKWENEAARSGEDDEARSGFWQGQDSARDDRESSEAKPERAGLRWSGGT